MIDIAQSYFNEEEVGYAIQKAIKKVLWKEKDYLSHQKYG